MQVFVVTSRATEEDSSGVIQRVKVRLHCVSSDAVLAGRIAEKYRGSVKEVTMDTESVGADLQVWTGVFR